jgi:serine protease Do
MELNRSARCAAAGATLAFLVAACPLEAKEPSPALELARQLNQAFIEVADNVSPAVVVVRIAHKANYNIELDDEEDSIEPFLDQMPREFRRWFEERRNRPRRNNPRENEFHRDPQFDGQGSGVVIRKEGYILTNRHVVEGADKIKIRFKDGTELDGEVRGVDAQSDVAVIKIDPKGKVLTVARLGDSEKTRVGEFAIAIGTPFELDYSVTFGHVSAKGRSPIRSFASAAMDQDYIQTDANINPGNSGGPLVNIEGEVIGINTLIRGMNTGIGFAIPINLAREVSEKLITDGKFVRAYLGVMIHALKEDTEYRHAITGVQEGVVIFEIPSGGPASKSDLKLGDVITAVDGKPISTAQQLKNEIRGKSIGGAVTLDVHRFGKNLKVKVRPEAWPDKVTTVSSRQPAPPDDKALSFGLTVEAVTKDLAEQFGLEKMEGVVVTEVERGSVAEKKGIEPGDVITELNQKPVNNPRQFRDALKSADTKKGVVINFTTRGTSKFEILKENGD